MDEGIPLAVKASRKALHEAQLSALDITHVVSTTCTHSANPGFDHFLCKELGMTQPVEKVLLHGIGCSGGLAALRTAANIALGSSFRKKKARVLVVALEISSIMVRSELDSMDKLQECRIGITLFSDCASAVVLSNGIDDHAEPVYDLLGWEHRIVPDTEADLGFDVHPLGTYSFCSCLVVSPGNEAERIVNKNASSGWKVILSPRVPKLASSIVEPTFNSLLESLPSLPPPYRKAPDFDWALHPGGATILSGVERVMSISPEHLRASYDTYINHGNSSSATIFSVLDRLRDKDMDAIAPDNKVKEFLVACAFGPGIAVEMGILRRNLRHVKRTLVLSGEVTPPETESEGSRSDGESEEVIEKEIESVKKNGELIGEKLATVQPDVPEQNDSLAEALNGVELD